MTMRTIWKGSVQFAMVTIPIRIFNATSPEDGIKFSQLHKGCHGPIGMQRFCKKCSAQVAHEDIVRGFEYAPSLYVVLQDEDFDSIKLKSAKVIDIQGFVRAAEVHPSLYDTPYFLGPDGEIAPRAYAVFREAMRETGKVAIGKVVMRDREETVLLSPEEHGILLYKLRSPHLMRTVEQVPGLDKTSKAEDRQVLMARSLIEALTVPLASIDLTDHYQDAVREMVAKKVAGEELISVPDQAYPVIDLENALTQSIEQVTENPPVLSKPETQLPAEVVHASDATTADAQSEVDSEKKRGRRTRELTAIDKKPNQAKPTAKKDGKEKPR